LTANNGSDSCIAGSVESDANNDGGVAARHRGKIIGADIKAADLAAAYRSIKSEYASLALDPASSTRWRPLSTHADGSEVSLLEHPDDPSCPYVRMTSVMPGTMQEVWDFLDLKNWETNMPKMDPFYESLSIMGEYKYGGIEMKLARKMTSRIVAFGKRDFTFVSVSDHPKNGAWVSGTVSVVTERIPREGGYVRAYQDSVAFYEAMDDDPETGLPRMKLTIVFRLDLNDSRPGGEGGFVPMWIYVKTVGATGMQSVQNMKRQLELLREEGRKSNDDGNGEKVEERACDGNWLARIRNGTRKC